MTQLVQRTGRVIAHDGHSVRIAFEKLGDCASCKAGHGCGIGPVVGMMNSTCVIRISAAELAIDDLSAGDSVRIGVSARQLALQVLLVYFLPLMGLFVGALCALLIASGSNDLAVGFGASAGMLCGYVGARALRLSLNLDVALQPQLARLSAGP